MLRTRRDLERASAGTGATLAGTRWVMLDDGSSVIEGLFTFEDPWSAPKLLGRLATEDASDPSVEEWGYEIAKATADSLDDGATDDQFRDALGAAIHRSVQGAIRFAPEEGERFQSARTTMISGVGDCDCHARLVHALATSQGVGSTLRYFARDGEPLHVVAALDTIAGPAWAETTIAARFGEHPLEAYERLRSSGAGEARSDLGFFGLDFVTSSDVRTRKTELDGYVQSLDRSVTLCPILDAPTRASWDDFRSTWSSFMANDPSWYDAGGQGRQAAEYATSIRSWQTTIASHCLTSTPALPAETQPIELSALKWVVGAVALVVGGVAIHSLQRSR